MCYYERLISTCINKFAISGSQAFSIVLLVSNHAQTMKQQLNSLHEDYHKKTEDIHYDGSHVI